MKIYLISDAFLGGFSLISALIVVLNSETNLYEQLKEMISKYDCIEKNQFKKEVDPREIKKIREYIGRLPFRILVSSCLGSASLIIYMISIFLKTIYPPLQSVSHFVFNFNSCPNYLLYTTGDGLNKIPANWISNLDLLLSWIQFILVLKFYSTIFRMIFTRARLSSKIR